MKELIIIDGYNLIFQHKELSLIAQKDLESAREKLAHILDNFFGIIEAQGLLVFDAFKSRHEDRKQQDRLGYSIIYTSKGQTADTYIEREAKLKSKELTVLVVTSDYLQQKTVFRGNVRRMSSREFLEELEWMKKELKDIYKKHKGLKFKPIEERIPKAIRLKLREKFFNR